MSDEERADPPKDERREMEERILKDAPRLGLKDKFKFACHPGVSCFNKCCGDVNIILSPYDVLRIKNRLGISSSDFLDKYTLLPIQKSMTTPIVLLRMNDDEAKTCQFLTDEGCGIYSDRPWPCRMYPVGMAAQKDTADGWRGERFYFLLQEDVCKGFGEPKEQTIEEWLEGQEVDDYDWWGEAFKELTLHEVFDGEETLSPEKMHMLFTACYDIDRFREFVFDSTLLQRFDVDEDFVDEMRSNDEALLRFAFLWLRFSLFGEPTVKAKPEVAEAFKGQLDKRELFKKESAVQTAGQEGRGGSG
jgi:Fe-S-cluster containining protein